MADEYPNIVISCLGGGSKFRGLALTFAADRIKNGHDTKFLAAQSQAAPNLEGT
ncbi:MAG: hypothetical protein V5A76_02880 [Candidatus Thermoplasmatota archaeon]